MSEEEVQLQELEALEAIYPGEIEILCRKYPNIAICVTLTSETADASADASCSFTLQISIKLPPKYPEEVPTLELNCSNALFSAKRINRVLDNLYNVARENLGMPLVFTIISTLQDDIGTLVQDLKTEKERLESELKEEEEARTRKKFEGTPVTIESFLKWKSTFDIELEAAREKKRKACEAALLGKLTGRQLFLRDTSLNLSDFAVMEAEEDVEIDESLFDEDLENLDLEDSGDDVQA